MLREKNAPMSHWLDVTSKADSRLFEEVTKNKTMPGWTISQKLLWSDETTFLKLNSPLYALEPSRGVTGQKAREQWQTWKEEMGEDMFVFAVPNPDRNVYHQYGEWIIQPVKREWLMGDFGQVTQAYYSPKTSAGECARLLVALLARANGFTSFDAAAAAQSQKKYWGLDK